MIANRLREMPPLNTATALARLNECVEQLRGVPPTPALAGRGIIICGGGPRYLPPLWVCIKMLRWLGCTLPIEAWHLGPKEMPPEVRNLLPPLGVHCVDAYEVRRDHPARILNGWEIKPYAMIHSRFAEVLLLDADNVPVVDPTFLFDAPAYRQHGAVFWPDYGRLGRDRPIWGFTGIPYRDEPEFESGQILVDKNRCWQELALTMWFNEYSDFWYRHVHGDKETFHMAWRKLERQYAMPARSVQDLAGTMCQHDFDGRRIFQHRNGPKWSLTGNRRVPGFEHEEACLGFLPELAEVWQGRSVRVYRPNAAEVSAVREAAAELMNRPHVYHRVGYDARELEFTAAGRIGRGSARCEAFWNLYEDNSGRVVLDIQSDTDLTCRLLRGSDGAWRGRWEHFERMPIELWPSDAANGINGQGRDHSQWGEQALILKFFRNDASGYFLDIGASDGVSHSNTRALVERGWTGAFVEPVPEEYWRLEDNYADAHGVQLVNAAVSDKDGFAEMWVCRRAIRAIDRRDNRHTLDPRFARAAAAGLNAAQYDRREVRTITVETLLRRIGRTRIDLVCVDAEGLDRQILRELLRAGVRPRLVVWEADKQPSDTLAVEKLLAEYGLREIFRTSVNRGWGR